MKTLQIIKIIGSVGLLILLAGLGAASAQEENSTNTGNWLHFGYDGRYTAYNPAEQLINAENIGSLARQWGLGCDDGGFSVMSRSPAVYDGVVFSSGAGRNLWANDARTGELLWEFGESNIGWAPQPVVSADGLVFYLVGINGIYDLFAVDVATGTEVWQSPLGFDIGFNDTALVTVDEARNRLYMLAEPFSGEGKVFALDMATGDVIWHMQEATENMQFAGDYALFDGDRLYVAAKVPGKEMGDPALDHMISIDAERHAIDTTYDAPNLGRVALVQTYAQCGDLLLAGYAPYYSDPTALLVAYQGDSPEIVWQSEFLDGITGTLACNPDLNRIYVPTNPFLYALDAATGAPQWKYAGFGPIYNPSVANGVVYFISSTNMYAVDEMTGEELFFYRLGHEGYETSQVAISDGMLYFSGNGGDCDLFALGLPSGEVGTTPPGR